MAGRPAGRGKSRPVAPQSAGRQLLANAAIASSRVAVRRRAIFVVAESEGAGVGCENTSDQTRRDV